LGQKQYTYEIFRVRKHFLKLCLSLRLRVIFASFYPGEGD